MPPSHFLPLPPVFLSQSVAGIPLAGLAAWSRESPHLPAYCAFERLLFGARDSSLFFSDPHPHGQREAQRGLALSQGHAAGGRSGAGGFMAH